MKAQPIRVLDVFVVGPAMVAGGSVLFRESRQERRALGALLVVSGVLTVVYNGANWLKRERQIDAAERAQERKQAPLAREQQE